MRCVRARANLAVAEPRAVGRERHAGHEDQVQAAALERVLAPLGTVRLANVPPAAPRARALA